MAEQPRWALSGRGSGVVTGHRHPRGGTTGGGDLPEQIETQHAHQVTAECALAALDEGHET